jgi:hypothetical protein
MKENYLMKDHTEAEVTKEDKIRTLQMCKKRTSPTLDEVKKNGFIMIEDKMFTESHCVECNNDFVLESNNDPAYDSPRVYEFNDVCNSCLFGGEVSLATTDHTKELV